METGKIHIRVAAAEDAQALLAIYAPYVENTSISFEHIVPSVSQFRDRIKDTLRKYPYLVAEMDGRILGYTYAGRFREREAYDWSVETSIYVDRLLKKQGIGRALYQALENALSEQHILNVNACIAYAPQEDEYLTNNSAQFHAHMGYTQVGEFHCSGFKFGRWYSMVWMEKSIGEHCSHPEPVLPFGQVLDIIRDKYGIE